MAKQEWKDYWASTAGSALMFAEVVLWPVFGLGRVRWLAWAGIALFLLGTVFCLVSLLQLTRQGGAAKGDNPAETTALIESGIYAIVRHPFYVGLVMVLVAMPLVVQRWIVAAFAVLSFALYLVDFRRVDSDEGTGKFGDAYREYAGRVPGWNPIAGVWRWMRGRGA